MVYPNCGAGRHIVAFLTEAAPVQRIPNRIGDPAHPPRSRVMRRPPDSDDSREALPDWAALAQPARKYQFDQSLG